jgi:PAN domain
LTIEIKALPSSPSPRLTEEIYATKRRTSIEAGMSKRLQPIFGCLIFLLALGNSPAVAQQKPAPNAPFHEIGKPKSITVDSNGKARDLVRVVLKQWGLKLDDSSWEIFVTQDGSDTPNAASNFVDGKRQIYFNSAFMDRIGNSNPDSYWTLYAIAAHELGHHLGNHVLRRWLRRPLKEREADYQAGFVLGRMGAEYQWTIDVVRWLPGGVASDYPPRPQRLCEIGRGWRDARGLEPIPEDRPGTSSSSVLQTCDGGEVDETVFQTVVNRDLYGNDILVDGKPGIPGIDLAACAAHCNETNECKAFSFDRWHGICFPKDGISNFVLDPPSIVGVKKPNALPDWNDKLPTVLATVRDREFRDEPLAPPQKMTNLDACRSACRSRSDCIAFTFSKTAQTCSMFEKTIGHYVSDLAVSGYKLQNPPSP